MAICRLQRFGATFCILLSSALTASCAYIDHVETRAETMNLSLADYDNTATLLNIIRASLFEPLEFTSSGPLKGYNNPHGAGTLAGARDYAFSTGVTVSNNNDFSVSVVEDPASYQALLSPLSPATLGFFIEQGYPRELVFNLFIDRVAVETSPKSGRFREYQNAPFAFHDEEEAKRGTPEEWNFECYASHLQSWIDQGLTVAIDRSAIPGTKVVPAHRICFDQHLRGPLRRSSASSISNGLRQMCPDIDGLAVVNTPDDNVSASPECSSPGAWTAPISLEPPSPNASGQNNPQGRKASGKSVPNISPVAYQTSWEVSMQGGRRVRLNLRSVFGAYNYIGRIVEKKNPLSLISNFDPSDTTFFTITNDDRNCFTKVEYHDQHWCIPNGANNSKRIFGLLRQVLRLNANPAVQPTTPTVRLVQ